ncbi:hypothetical protein B566_EDAN003769 [Ephemera danica]|nr:hypothetical protein B566_EDAN003769 [Ephemera danica]
MAGVTKYTIADLSANETNVMLIAIIVAKQAPRVLPGWKGVRGERAVWNFTIRDSPTDTINVAAWGSEQHVFGLANSFQTGDIVVITKPRVSFRQESEEKFTPYVNSDLSLSLDETHSSMQVHPEPEIAAYLTPLLHVTTKPTTNFLTLADIERRGESDVGGHGSKQSDKAFVDLLVAVSKVCIVKSVKRKKDGQMSQYREVLLMDYTVNGMSMMLWNPDLIYRAEAWKPGQTVLFIADAMVEKREWNKRMVVSVGMRTIITENPQSTEAETLRDYAVQQPLQLMDQLDQIHANITNPKSINKVMTVQQVNEIVEQQFTSSRSSREIYALLFCVPVNLDLDGSLCSVLATRCLVCKNLVDHRIGICEQCQLPDAQQSSNFDIRVTLADHTGSLSGVRLSGNTAEKVLGITANEFKLMSDDERTILKWRLLLERCAVRVVIVQGTTEQSRPVISIIECERVDPREAAARYPAN